MNLDKLLKKLELNKASENEQKTYPFTIGGETYDVKTLTRAKKREFLYMFETGGQKLKIGDIVKRAIPFIYISFDLAALAERAKQDKLIVKYYDVVELLFEPDEIVQIVSFIMEINNLSDAKAEEEVDEIKKP